MEDRYNLELWGKRMVGIGLAQQPHLLAQVAACPIDDAKRLNKLVEEAAKFGGSQTGAGLGTALHEFTARVDAGDMSSDSIIDPWAGDVRAYLAALDAHGLEVVRDLVEVQLVHDELRLAGTADRFLRRRDGRLVCADVKTGKSIGDNPLAYVVQLAAYADSVLYDPVAGIRTPVGDVDLTVGLLIHLPAGKATCTIHEVDLVAGLELARLAGIVRAAQKRRDLVRIVGAPSPAVLVETKHTERLRWVRDRIVVLRDLGARIDWPVDLITPRQALDPTFPDDASADDVERMVAVLDAAERGAQAPFPPEDPTTPEPEPLVVVSAARTAAPAKPNEGRPLTDGERDELKLWVNAHTTDADVAELVNRCAREGGRELVVAANPSERRRLLAWALVRLANHGEEVLRAACALVIADAAQPAVAIGSALAAMSLDEAQRLLGIAEALDDGRMALTFDETGPVLADVA